MFAINPKPKTKFDILLFFVQGGGHYAAEDMVKECAAMIDRWMAYFPL